MRSVVSPGDIDSTGAYLDYAAAAPPFPEALQAAFEAAKNWFANPSALHGAARDARDALQRFRAELCALCGFEKGRLVLMSGATEANNWVIHGVMGAQLTGRVLVSADSHASMWNPARRYADRVDILPIDAQGSIAPTSLAAMLKPGTRLVCVPHAASETGVIHDVAALAAVCRDARVALHVDGAQSVGHLPVNVSEIDCDYYVFAAHKFGGIRGCGGVFVSPRMKQAGCGAADPSPAGFQALMEGGSQEWGLRPGTENLMAAAAAAAALRRALGMLPTEMARLRALAVEAAERIVAALEGATINGNPAEGLPGLLSVSFRGLNGRALAAEMGHQGFAIASGSACSEDRPEPSRAILAMGRTEDVARGTVRISFGMPTTAEIMRAAVASLIDVVRRHRQTCGNVADDTGCGEDCDRGSRIPRKRKANSGGCRT